MISYSLKLLTGLVFFSQVSFAGLPAGSGKMETHDAQAIRRHFVGVKSWSGLISEAKSSMPQGYAEFLESKIKELPAGESLPKILKNGQDSLRIMTPKTSITVKVVDAKMKILSVNGHQLQFSPSEAPQAAWDKILAALPQNNASSTFPLIDLLLPEAQAILPFIIGGIAIAGLAVVGFFTAVNSCGDIEDGIKKCENANAHRNDPGFNWAEDLARAQGMMREFNVRLGCDEAKKKLVSCVNTWLPPQGDFAPAVLPPDTGR